MKKSDKKPLFNGKRWMKGRRPIDLSRNNSKWCSHCAQRRPISDFYRMQKTPSKLSFICKECNTDHHLFYSSYPRNVRERGARNFREATKKLAKIVALRRAFLSDLNRVSDKKNRSRYHYIFKRDGRDKFIAATVRMEERLVLRRKFIQQYIDNSEG